MHTFSPSKMWIARAERASEAVPASAHAVQSRPAVGHDRHGLHEPEPGGARRPRGGLHPHAPASARARSSSATGPIREVQDRIGAWMRAARAWHDWQGAKFCRFGDNMRQVAVTEGDKVAAEMNFGFAINGYGVGDLVAEVERRLATPTSKALAARIRGALRRRAGAAQGRRPARVAALRRAARTRPARVPRGRRLQGLHDHLRGFARAAGSCPASRRSG